LWLDENLAGLLLIEPRCLGKEECTDEVIDPAELVAKRLRLLRELVPKAVRVAVLLNPDRVSIKPFDAVQIDNQGEDRFGSNRVD
jgi:hypothetical protein